MWLVSALSAFLTSALLLEPLKVSHLINSRLNSLGDNSFDLHFHCPCSGVCADLDLRSTVEACGSRGGGPAGAGDHCGEVIWRAWREGSPTMWLRAATG